MSGEHRGKWRGKKRSKAYYVQSAKPKKFKLNALEPGMKGFLVTCNAHEDQAARECYDILNEYADKLYGPEKLSGDKISGDDDKDHSDSSHKIESDDEDIEKALQKEVTAIKTTKPTERRFQRLDCSANKCVFIKANIADPSELAHEVLSDIAQSKVFKSRYALRLLPVQVTCKAYVEDILKTAETLLEPHFRLPFGESLTFSVLLKSRNNSSIPREKIVSQIGSQIKEMNPLNSCDYYTPNRVVLVEVVCKVCCLSVVKDYYQLRKYNLHEVATPKVEETESEKQVKAENIGENAVKPDSESTMKGSEILPETPSEKTSAYNVLQNDEKNNSDNSFGLCSEEAAKCMEENSKLCKIHNLEEKESVDTGN